MDLDDRDKRYTNGTHRVRPPAETLRAVEPFLQTMGITRLANVTGLDEIGIPVWQAIRPNARSVSVSQGKGIDDDCARASAVMEAIELWHAEHIERPLRIESYAELARRAAALDPRRLALRLNAQPPVDRPIAWIEGIDLIAGEPTWVPYELVTMNAVDAPGRARQFFGSSNGLASGNHSLEAIIHGLCELIERDATTLWLLGADQALADSRIDLGAVGDAHCRALLERFDAAGIDVAAWDMTSESAIPTFSCCILERSDRPRWRTLGAFWGYGTHPSWEVALSRALTEGAQSRLTMISASRDDTLGPSYRAQANRHLLDQVRAELFAQPGRRRPDAHGAARGDSLRADVDRLLDGVRRLGADRAVAVDLTRPELGIPVVRVVAPGLESLSLLDGYRAGARALAKMGGRS